MLELTNKNGVENANFHWKFENNQKVTSLYACNLVL